MPEAQKPGSNHVSQILPPRRGGTFACYQFSTDMLPLAGQFSFMQFLFVRSLFQSFVIVCKQLSAGNHILNLKISIKNHSFKPFNFSIMNYSINNLFPYTLTPITRINSYFSNIQIILIYIS